MQTGCYHLLQRQSLLHWEPWQSVVCLRPVLARLRLVRLLPPCWHLQVMAQQRRCQRPPHLHWFPWLAPPMMDQPHSQSQSQQQVPAKQRTQHRHR
jgi:hypothetical protein